MTTVDVEDITIPDSPAALEEFLHDPKKVAAIIRQGQLQDLVLSYAKNVLDKQVDIGVQVQEQVERAMAQFLREHEDGGFTPANMAWSSPMADLTQASQPRADSRMGLYNSRAIGAQLDKAYSDRNGRARANAVADFFQLIWHNRNLDMDDQKQLRNIRNAFQSTEGAGGGFLIPEVLRSELLRINLENAIVRPRARIVPMETLRVNLPAIDSTSHASSVYGGIVSYWEEEGATHQDSSPNFGQLALQARKLVTYTEVPNELMSDSVGSLQLVIGELFPEALSFDEDYAFLTGNGAGKPLGALNTTNPATIEVQKETDQVATTIYWENIIKMYSRMLPGSQNRAVWIVSHDVFPELATMALSVGTGGVPVWMTDGHSAPQLTLLGRPIIPTEKTPAALGTRGDITFWDPGFYLVGDRQMMSATSSEHARFTTDKTVFKIVSRVDGRPWLQSPITPRNGGATLSSTVQLATRS
jgi:HK97 family phage major capsid protein